MQSRLYKLEGHEVVPVNNLYEWAEWMDSGELAVECTRVGPITVSTAFLGMSAPRCLDGAPLTFETVLLGGGAILEVVERYSTWAEAEQGHKKWTRRAPEKAAAMKLSNA